MPFNVQTVTDTSLAGAGHARRVDALESRLQAQQGLTAQLEASVSDLWKDLLVLVGSLRGGHRPSPAPVPPLPPPPAERRARPPSYEQ